MKLLAVIALVLVLAVPLVGAAAESRPAEPGEHAAVRSLADVMSQPPFLQSGDVFRAWILEKSEDFGVVLIETKGTIPLHMHPDGNRRMFLIEGAMTMKGGEHEMDMKPGDYMYLPRNHHHKVWLAQGAKRALFLLVDNPPTSTSNVIWLESTPELARNPEQAKTAFSVADRCESGAVKP